MTEPLVWPPDSGTAVLSLRSAQRLSSDPHQPNHQEPSVVHSQISQKLFQKKGIHQQQPSQEIPVNMLLPTYKIYHLKNPQKPLFHTFIYTLTDFYYSRNCNNLFQYWHFSRNYVKRNPLNSKLMDLEAPAGFSASEQQT